MDRPKIGSAVARPIVEFDLPDLEEDGELNS